MTGGALTAALAITLPALAFALWPLVRRGTGGRRLLPIPETPRERLLESKRAALRALRELQFEHGAGHVSDDDYAELRARYEAEAAALIRELDALGPDPAPAPRPAAAARPEPAPARAGWRHPLAVGTTAVALVAFGVALGVGVVRYTEPDPLAGMPLPGSRPLATLEPGPGPAAAGGGGALAPGMLQGMLQAARSSLFAGRYGEAIAAYQAVLKREPDNVDALTHLGLIVYIGGHTDHALENFERSLALQPDYPPALLYRGQVLLEARQDYAGAIASWERFAAVVPAGEDRDRVLAFIEAAKALARNAATPAARQ